MTRTELKSLILEAIIDEEKQKIDNFIQEFKDFDLKQEKVRLKSLTRQLAELHHHVNKELYHNKSDKYTRSFWKMKEDIQNLHKKIQKYKLTKDSIDTLARTHKSYVFQKHGKLV